MRDLDVALDLVRRADRANAGIVLDAWHFVRGGGRASQIGPDAVAAVVCVQLCDGSAPDPALDPYEETLTRRLPPGMGTFDLFGLVRALVTCGYDGPWSIEVLSGELTHRPVAEVVASLTRATVAVLDDAVPSTHAD